MQTFQWITVQILQHQNSTCTMHILELLQMGACMILKREFKIHSWHVNNDRDIGLI